jgi:PadR family transcriptional regulator PadR
MDLENTQSQMRKGILEYCVLQVIACGECYSSDIIDQLKSVEMIVVEGTLYPLLTRLKNGGLLQYKWEESESGPPRKYFSLTPQGLDFLTNLDQTWNQLSAAVNHVQLKRNQINKSNSPDNQ